MVGDISRSQVLTLEQMLALESIATGRPEILAARQKLGSHIRWVHISEELDIADYLRGGEVLLATTMALSGQPRERIERYVTDLAERQLSALIIRPPEGWVPPSGLIETAERLAFPIVRLNRRVSFADVTEEVQDALLGQRLRWMRLTESLRQELATIALRADGLEAVIERLARIVNLPVVLEDRRGEVITAASPDGDRSRALRGWEHDHDRVMHLTGGDAGGARIASGCAWSAISLGGGHWSTLHVLTAEPPFDEALRAAIEAAVPALRVSGILASDDTALRNRAHDRIVAGIFAGSLEAPDDVRREFRAQGIALRELPLVAMCIRMVGGRSHDIDEVDSERSRMIERSRLLLPARLASSPRLVFAGRRGGTLLGLIESVTGEPLRGELETAGAELLAESGWSAGPDHPRITIGLSRGTDLGTLKRAFEEAMNATRFGPTLEPVSVHTFEDFRLHHLLAGLSRRELRSFVDDELGLLLAHDRERGTSLTQTLEVYWRNSANATLTARDLFIERRTLYHRLRTIEKLVGSVQLSETLETLALALTARAVLESVDPVQNV